MNPITAAYIANVLSDLTIAIIGQAGRQLRRLLSQDEGEQALERCLQAGVVALLAEARNSTTTLADNRLLEYIFTEFFEQPDTIHALGPLLSGNPVNRADLAEIFADLGYDTTHLRSLDFERAITLFETGFIAAATNEPVLKPSIQTGQLLEQNRLHRDILSEMQKLVEFLHQIQPSSIGITAGQITGQDAAGRQITHQTSPQVKARTISIVGDSNVIGNKSRTQLSKQKGGHNAMQIGQVQDKKSKSQPPATKDAPTTPTQADSEAQQAQNLTIKGDGNVIGDGSSSQITEQEAGDSSIQIGELDASSFSLADLLRLRADSKP